MAKATITTPQGIHIKIDGTPAEITAVLRNLGSTKGTSPKNKTSPRKLKGKPGRASLVDLIASLIDGGFFKKPQDLTTVKNALAEMGHHYPVTTLSPTMLRLVRKRNLRRIREEKRWTYVN